jgi:hypothetical protein
MPKVEYPAFFEEGLIGIRCTETVQPREAFISVPYKMIFSVDKAKSHPVLKGIIRQNPGFFSPKHRRDFGQHILTLFIFYELTLGKKSYWYPWLRCMPTVHFTCHWDPRVILESGDPDVVSEIKDYSDEVMDEWLTFRNILKMYPEIFPKRLVCAQLFYNVYA